MQDQDQDQDQDHKDKKGEKESHVTYATADMPPSLFSVSTGAVDPCTVLYAVRTCAVLLHVREIKSVCLL